MEGERAEAERGKRKWEVEKGKREKGTDEGWEGGGRRGRKISICCNTYRKEYNRVCSRGPQLQGYLDMDIVNSKFKAVNRKKRY